MSGGSFIDPAEERLKAKHAELDEAVKVANEKATRMHQRYGMQPNPADIQIARLTMLFDIILPAHVDGKEHDPTEPPTNPERLDFEIEYHRQMAEVISEQLKELDAMRASAPPKKLHVAKGGYPGTMDLGGMQ